MAWMMVMMMTTATAKGKPLARSLAHHDQLHHDPGKKC
jgi:hypothetical protein